MTEALKGMFRDLYETYMRSLIAAISTPRRVDRERMEDSVRNALGDLLIVKRLEVLENKVDRLSEDIRDVKSILQSDVRSIHQAHIETIKEIVLERTTTKRTSTRRTMLPVA